MISNAKIFTKYWKFLAVVLKISAISLKCPTFEGVSFMFSWAKKYKDRVKAV